MGRFSDWGVVGRLLGELHRVFGSELLDVHVVPGQDPDVRHEPRGAEHVPHPGIPEHDLDPAILALVELHLVGEVEPPLGLDDVLEHRHDVAVLAIELELALLFETLDVVFFGVHGSSSLSPS